MTTFDQQNEAYEQKFAYDKEVTFKVNARRNSMIGAWAAHLLKYDTDQADLYCDMLIKMGVSDPNQAIIVDTIYNDLKKSGIEIEETEVTKQMRIFFEMARNELGYGDK